MRHFNSYPKTTRPAGAEVAQVEYQQLIAATERQFTDEARDIEAHRAEVDTA